MAGDTPDAGSGRGRQQVELDEQPPKAAGIAMSHLLMALTFGLVTSTTLFTAGLSVYNGWQAEEEARQVGRDGVSTCLADWTEQQTLVQNQLFNAIQRALSEEVLEYLRVPEMGLIALIASFAGIDPRALQSPRFLSTTLRMGLIAYVRAFAQWLPVVEQIQYHGAGIPPAVGGRLMFAMSKNHLVWETLGVDEATAVAAAPLFVFESSNGTGFQTDTTNMRLGVVGPEGDTLFEGAPCGFQADGRIGPCVVGFNHVYPPGSTSEQVVARALGAPGRPPTDAANRVHLSPVTLEGTALTIVLYGAWTPTATSLTEAGGENADESRVGVFMISCTLGELSKEINETQMPDGSYLYIVERNPWTDTVGTLIGANVGPVKGTSRGKTTLLDVRNHTTGDGRVVDLDAPMQLSPVAKHGAHMIRGGADDYESLTSSDVVLWDAGRDYGGVWWTAASKLRKVGSGQTIGWYVTIITPSATVMEKLSVSTAKLELSQVTADEDARAHARKALVILAIVVVAWAVALMVMSVVFTKRIVAPIDNLSSDMGRIACMDLEGVPERPLSGLREVGAMQTSFQQMIVYLLHYRAFMPESVLVEGADDDSGSAEDGLSTAGSSSMVSRSYTDLFGAGKEKDGVLEAGESTLAVGCRSDGDGATLHSGGTVPSQRYLGAHRSAKLSSRKQVAGANPLRAVRDKSDEGHEPETVLSSDDPSEDTQSVASESSVQTPTLNRTLSRGSRAWRSRKSLGTPSDFGAGQSFYSLGGGAGAGAGGDRPTPPPLALRHRLSDAGANPMPVGGPRALALAGTELKRRTVVLLLLNISNFRALVGKATDADICGFHSDYIALVTRAITTMRGVAEPFTGDRLLASFNGCRRIGVSTAMGAAGQCAEAIRTDALDLPAAKRFANDIDLSLAIAAADARLGVMGSTSMRKFTMLTSAIDFVTRLEALNAEMLGRGMLRGTGLVDQAVQGHLKHKFQVRLLGVVCAPKHAPGGVLFGEMLCGIKTSTEEWMYQMERAEADNPFLAWNTAVEKMIRRETPQEGEDDVFAGCTLDAADQLYLEAVRADGQYTSVNLGALLLRKPARRRSVAATAPKTS